MNHMKALITEEFALLNDDIELCQTICNSAFDCCQMCESKEGKHFEHLH